MLTVHVLKKGPFLKALFVSSVLFLSLSAQSKTLIFQSVDTPSSDPGPVVLSPPPSEQTKSVTTPQVQPQTQKANTELFFMVSDLKREVSKLHGMLEERDYQIRQLQNASKSRYRDMDRQIQALGDEITKLKLNNPSAAAKLGTSGNNSDLGTIEAAGSVPTIVPVVSPTVNVKAPNIPETEDQKAEYQSAYSLVKTKRFDEASEALLSYIEKYPQGNLTGNAFYWLGEVYLVLPNLEQAKQSFKVVVETFPGHSKQADAIYKLAVTYDRLGALKEAESNLKKVQDLYPNSTASKLAKNYKLSR